MVSCSRLPIFTRLDRLLERCMARIETPVEGKEDLARLGTQGVDTPLRVGQAWRKRLFTHDGLSGLNRPEYEVDVCV